MKGRMKKFIALFLVVVLVVSTLSGCGENADSGLAQLTPTESAEKIAEKIIEGLKQEDASTIENVITQGIEIQQPEENGNNNNRKVFSMNWEDYIGDVETFVYGLFTEQMRNDYNVFPGYVEKDNGEVVSGIVYTDFDEAYQTEEEDFCYFGAGFIPYRGELSFTEEELESGLEIFDAEYELENTGFLLTYESVPFQDHCVVYGKYVKYGVDENGHLTYEYEDYVDRQCDESLGALYSFDESRYLFDPEGTAYVPLNGESLSSLIDFEELQREVNEILESQDQKLLTENIETYAYAAQGAISAYFLSLQEETFLGYSVEELRRLSCELDPMECYRLTADGILTIEFNNSSVLTQWLVGTASVILAAIGIVGSVLFIECPPLSLACGALTGFAIEIFMQVVIEDKALDEIDWVDVCIAVAAGAISGFAGPYMAGLKGVGGFLADSALDGLIGGLEYMVRAWLDGEEGTSYVEAFGFGFALGFGLSAVIKIIGKGGGALISKISKTAAAQKLGNAVSKIGKNRFKNIKSSISSLKKTVTDKLKVVRDWANKSVFHSQYVSDKILLKQLGEVLEKEPDKLLNDSVKQLSKSHELLNAEGNVIDKKMLKELFKEADDGSVLAHFKIGDEIIDVKKQNGAIGVFFDEKFATVKLDSFISSDRSINLPAAADKLKSQWLDNEELIPDSIKQKLVADNLDLESMKGDDLYDLISKSDWVLHENLDLKTVSLVPRYLHDAAEDGVKHYGGVGLAKYLKNYFGTTYFDRILSTAATGAVIATEDTLLP